MSRGENNAYDDFLKSLTCIINSNANLQSNLNNFLSARNASTSALDALQNYGSAIQSPSLNGNLPLTSSDAASSCTHFNSLNLNSVEEEDEFLYGNSDSIPEANTSVKEEPATNSTRRLDTGWSDDEDPYGESSVTTLGKLSSERRKNISDCGFQDKTQTVKFYVKEKDESHVEYSAPSVKIPDQKYLLQSDVSTLSPQTEKSQYFVSDTSSNFVKDRSKYRTAAEILKKQNVEKTSEKSSTFSGIPKNISELEYKSLHTDLKADNLDTKRQRQIPKIINKKHLGNIRDYITGPPQRKRSHPCEEFGPEKHPRNEALRSFSPSRRHSPHKSSLPYKHRSSHASSERDNLKYASFYSRHRSPSYENEKHYSRYLESHRQYSSSPKRWSHEKSPDYRHRSPRSRRSRDRSPRPQRSRDRSPRSRRSKDRSPRSRRSRSKSRRSRSRSPGYYSSRSKTYSKKEIHKSYRHKEKSSNSSAESYCSLSLGSSSDSSSESSDESSGERKKSKKPPVETAPEDNRKHEDMTANLKDLDSKKSDNALSDEISKKIAGIFNVKDSNLLNPANIHDLVNALKPPDTSQQLIELIEGLQRQQQPMAVSQIMSPAVTDINITSNLQMPVISTPESYAYPPVPTAPVQYVAPQVPDFTQMIHATAFPAPAMAPEPSTQYGPYLPVQSVPVVSSNQSNVPKSGKVRQSTLRSIPVSDSLLVTSASSSNITIVPNNSSLQKSTKSSHESTKSKPQESKSSLKFPEQSLEKNTKYFKEIKGDKNFNSSPKVIYDSTSEQNKLLMIEKYKKLKAGRAKAQEKSISALADLAEMRKIMDNTFGKIVSPEDRVVYAKCRTMIDIALDTASNVNKDARHLDEDLNKFKAKLSTALQAEVSKIKLEQCKEEVETDEVYSCLDQGNHNCFDCCIQFNTIKNYLTHVQTPEHKESMESSNNEWKKDFIKEEKKETGPEKKAVIKAVRGVEFLKPLTGFYCTLCKEVIIDVPSTEQHVRGHRHCLNYLNFIKRKPLYERKSSFKQFISYTMAKKQKQLKAIEERKKSQEAAEKKSKEILQNEKSKEVRVEELEQEDNGDLLSNNQKTANIKLNLSEKDKSNEKQKSSKELETKNSTKFIYIGKAPNFKKNQSQKSTPWYQRENILSKKESNSDSSSSNVINAIEIAAKESQSSNARSSSSIKTSEMSNCYDGNLELKLKKKLKNIEGIKQQQAQQKKNQEACEKKSKEILDKNTKSSDKVSVSENKHAVTKQITKNKLSASSSSKYKNVPLSEITLPEVSSLPSFSNANAPQPMDIDNSQDVQGKPKSEEEKDFLLLGINKEDFQPLVVPVPPPTSMVSYPNLYNTQTLSTSVSCISTSTSSIQHTLKTLDFSIPPPTIAPYQNNVPSIPVYNNQNNAQNIGPFSYPTNNQQMPLYSNQTRMNLQTDYQTVSPFSTPPPAFRNPPPMHPYSNTGNMPPAPQFSGTNNLPYNTSFPNSMPPNRNNQPYQPSMYSVPPNNQTLYSAANTSQSVAPPGSACDKFMNNTTNFNAVSPASTYIHQSKTSTNLQKVGNLIRIVPENTPFQISESVSDSKAIKFEEITSKTNDQYNCEFPTDDNKGNKNDIKRNQAVANNVICDKTLKTCKIVGNIEESSYETLDRNEKMDKRCLESEVKLVIDECIEKIELKELKDCNNKKSVKSSLIVEIPVILNNSTICEKQIPSQNVEVINDIVLEESSNICSLAANSGKTDKATKDRILDSEDNRSTLNVTNNSVVSKYEQVNVNVASEFSCDKIEKHEDVDGTNVTIMIEEEDIRDLSNDKNVQNEGIKSYMKPTIEILEENKKSLDNVDLAPMPGSDAVDSNHHEISHLKITNKNNENESKETSIKICEKQVPAENMEVEDNADFVNPSENICSLAGISNKIDEVTEDRDLKVELLKYAEEVTDGTILGNEPILNQNNDVTNDSVLSKHEDETYKKNHEKDCDELMEVSHHIVSEKFSTECCFPEENSNVKTEKGNEVEMLNVSTMIEEENIDDSCIDKNVQNENIKSYVKPTVDIFEPLEENKISFENVDPVSINNNIESNHYQVFNMKVENKSNENESEETSTKISEKQIPAQSMEINYSIDLEESSDNICFSADTSNKIDEVNGESTEVSMTVIADEKITEGNVHDSNITLKKSIEIVTMESKQKEIKANYSVATDEALENNMQKNMKMCKVTLQSIDVVPMSVSDGMGSSSHTDENLTETALDQDEANEPSKLRNGKTRGGRTPRKKRGNWKQKGKKKVEEDKVLKSGEHSEGDSSVPVKPAFEDHSSSSSTKVIEKGTGDKNVLETNISAVTSKKSIKENVLHDKNVLETECEELSSNLDANKDDQTSENVPNLLEDAEISPCDQVKTNLEDIPQEMHLKLNKSCEISSIPENKTETLESGYQESEVLENKTQAIIESASDGKCEINLTCTSETPNKRCTGSKHSSDTEEYEE